MSEEYTGRGLWWDRGGSKNEDPFGAYTGHKLALPSSSLGMGAAIMRFILTQAWEPMQGPPLCVN